MLSKLPPLRETIAPLIAQGNYKVKALLLMASTNGADAIFFADAYESFDILVAHLALRTLPLIIRFQIPA